MGIQNTRVSIALSRRKRVEQHEQAQIESSCEQTEADGRLGNVLIQLFTDKEPQLSENFRVLCTGEMSDERCNIGFVGRNSTRVSSVASAEMIRFSSTTESAFSGEPFALVQPDNCTHIVPLRHDCAGLLTMIPEKRVRDENADDKNTQRCDENVDEGLLYSSCFAITLGPCELAMRDKGCRVFGKVLRGMALLREIEREAGVLSCHGGRDIIEAVECFEIEDAYDDGTILWPDGDPFPRWPQDAPQMRQRDQYENRVAASETIKAYGTDSFNEGNYALADAKYTKALRYLDKKFTREAEVYEQEMKERVWQAQLKVPLLLNSALCKIKLGDGRGAIKQCNEAQEWLRTQSGLDSKSIIEGRGSSQTEKKSPKLLLRRGMAHAMCHEYDDALKDLRKASAIMPKDAYIRKELERVKSEAVVYHQRKRDTYSHIFEG